MCQIFMRQEAQASFMPVRAALKSGLILEKLNYWTVYWGKNFWTTPACNK